MCNRFFGLSVSAVGLDFEGKAHRSAAFRTLHLKIESYNLRSFEAIDAAAI